MSISGMRLARNGRPVFARVNRASAILRGVDTVVAACGFHWPPVYRANVAALFHREVRSVSFVLGPGDAHSELDEDWQLPRTMVRARHGQVSAASAMRRDPESAAPASTREPVPRRT